MSWQRLESGTIDPDLYEGQEARIADPAWLLGRQWQVGEFKGEDAASPVIVEATIDHAPITRLRPGAPKAGAPVVQRGALGLPLETAVEREAVRSGPAAVRLAADAGLQLWRFLDTAKAPAGLAPAIRAAFALTLPADDGLDAVGRAQLKLLARRSFDARKLHDELTLRAGAALKNMPGMSTPAVSAAVATWDAWYAGLYSEPQAGAAAWDPEHMEYRFQIAAGVSTTAEVQLDAREYTGGHLDWYGFDLVRGNPDMSARGALTSHTLRVLPTAARYAGQAAARWWEVENETVWFGDLGTAPEDLARVAVAAYGTLFGRDWFLVPARLPTGVLARARGVTVIDTFGERHPIASCAENDGPGRTWRGFELTGDPAADATLPKDRVCPWLLLPPALAGVTQSPPIEAVELLRDETANLGWAAELRIESAAARTIDRAALARAAMTPPPELTGDAWRYSLATPVPDHQVPLVPVTRQGALMLQRGRLATAADGGVQTRGALGRILQPDKKLLIQDDEVPATGVRVTRTWQMARSADGAVVLWVGRRKAAGRPVRSPGLVFDGIETRR
jgi:hypothetical protein